MNYKNAENIIEKALIFATLAHRGQVRKGETNKPLIIHPTGVAITLHQYGADDNLIAAGYLHDIVEDTKYKLEDIKRIFGEDIAHLVDIATDKNKEKSWEERRKITIQFVKDLCLREKMLITADKINNIEDINRIFEINGDEVFSSFSKGKVEQEWYYRNIYKSLIQNEDPQNPLFQRLEKGINSVFGRSMEAYEKSVDEGR